MNEPEDREGITGIEIPEGVELEDSDRSKAGVISAIIIVFILAFQAVSAHFIVKELFFSGPSAGPGQTLREDSEPIGEVFHIQGIIVNPQETRGTRHLLVDIALEGRNPRVLEELARREPQIRDNLVTFFSAQSVEVLTDIKMREKIREKVKEIVNYYLGEQRIGRVFFTSYVFQ